MDTIDQLFDAARAARANAYAPYSEFPVGAAIRTATGAIFSGCNVENAAYPSGVCAETAAIAAMAVAGERRGPDHRAVRRLQAKNIRVFDRQDAGISGQRIGNCARRATRGIAAARVWAARSGGGQQGVGSR
jgi:homotetrameric cytidine deaminase